MYATCLSAALGDVSDGTRRELPVALAPGMGEKLLLRLTLLRSRPPRLGLTWQQALAAVLMAGLFSWR